MILGSENSVALLVMLFLETESEKFKMAAAKTGCTCISASIQDSKKIPACFGVRELNGDVEMAPY
jgi:hypothetical protein